MTVESDRIFINGNQLDEPYIYLDPLKPRLVNQMELTVEPGHLFVLGDNRNHSSDSRSWGTVSFSNVQSRVFAVVWPLSHFKILH